MSERTKDELADALKMLCENMDPCGKCTTCEAAARLRSTPEGERIEGWAWPVDPVDKEAFDNGNIEAKWLSFELWKSREELTEAVKATGDPVYRATLILQHREDNDERRS